MKSIFTWHRIPEMVISDSDPSLLQTSTQNLHKIVNLNMLLVVVCITHRVIVKLREQLVLLLACRSTPLTNGFSPSKLLMSKKLQTTVQISKIQHIWNVPKQKHNCDNIMMSKICLHWIKQTVLIPNQDAEVVVGEEVAPRSYEPIPSKWTYHHNPRDIIIFSNVGNDSHDLVTEETGNSKQQRHSNCLSISVMHQFSAEIHKSLIVCFILDSIDHTWNYLFIPLSEQIIVSSGL